jgi:hypothetical protein
MLSQYLLKGKASFQIQGHCLLQQSDRTNHLLMLHSALTLLPNVPYKIATIIKKEERMENFPLPSFFLCIFSFDFTLFPVNFLV